MLIVFINHEEKLLNKHAPQKTRYIPVSIKSFKVTNYLKLKYKWQSYGRNSWCATEQNQCK